MESKTEKLLARIIELLEEILLTMKTSTVKPPKPPKPPKKPKKK